jgi:hypothetical protein
MLMLALSLHLMTFHSRARPLYLTIPFRNLLWRISLIGQPIEALDQSVCELTLQCYQLYGNVNQSCQYSYYLTGEPITSTERLYMGHIICERMPFVSEKIQLLYTSCTGSTRLVSGCLTTFPSLCLSREFNCCKLGANFSFKITHKLAELGGKGFKML